MKRTKPDGSVVFVELQVHKTRASRDKSFAIMNCC
jgi:hypothetical protein